MKILIMHQTIAAHDAIGADIEMMYHILNEKFDCVCYAVNAFNKQVEYIDTEEELVQYINQPTNVIIYHHSVYWKEGEEYLKKAKAKIIFRYHNITPPEFFQPYNEFHYMQCKLGREQTLRLIKEFPQAFWLADSVFNTLDLESVNQERKGVCPPFHKIEIWSEATPKEEILKQLLESKQLNLLFVGRIAPNKGHLFLIEALYWYCKNFDCDVKLHIIGKFDEGLSEYNDLIKGKIKQYGLSNNIEFIGEIDDSILLSYYLGCDVFVCASEHEGFCVPLIESQFFELPIIALESTAVGETLGLEQIVLTKSEKEFASAFKILKDNLRYVRHLREQGKKNYEDRFAYEKIEKCFLQFFNEKMGVRL